MERVFLKIEHFEIELSETLSIGFGEIERVKKGWVVKMPSAQNLEGKEGMLEALSIAAQTTKTVSGWKTGDVELWDVVEIFDNEEDATAAGKVCENMTIYQIETGRLKWLD